MPAHEDRLEIDDTELPYCFRIRRLLLIPRNRIKRLFDKENWLFMDSGLVEEDDSR